VLEREFEELFERYANLTENKRLLIDRFLRGYSRYAEIQSERINGPEEVKKFARKYNLKVYPCYLAYWWEEDGKKRKKLISVICNYLLNVRTFELLAKECSAIIKQKYCPIFILFRGCQEMKFGIIGFGNIGGLFLEKILTLDFVEKIFVNDKQSSKLKKIEGLEKVEILKTPQEICKKSDYILLSVKPQDFGDLFNQIKDVDFSQKVIISPITGLKIQKLEALKNSKNIARIMPNLPCYIGKGTIGIAYSDTFEIERKDRLIQLLSTLGEVEEFEEYKFSALTSYIGSAPGIIFLLIEAFIDSGIKLGLSAEQSKKIAIQNLIGSSEMLKELDKEPSELRKMVCSPSGTTIEAVYSLEKSGVRGDLMESFVKAFEKAKFLEKEAEK
jgi:pyrroline-5-carboxylate reductase